MSNAMQGYLTQAAQRLRLSVDAQSGILFGNQGGMNMLLTRGTSAPAVWPLPADFGKSRRGENTCNTRPALPLHKRDRCPSASAGGQRFCVYSDSIMANSILEKPGTVSVSPASRMRRPPASISCRNSSVETIRQVVAAMERVCPV